MILSPLCSKLPLSLLFLNGSQLKHVNSFKYLGVIITSNLSCSSHIQSVSSKAHQTIGIIYRNFYKHIASPHTLLSLYCSLVILYFTYCSFVLDPPVSSSNSEILEKTQHFALKMRFHKWDSAQILTFQPSQLVTRYFQIMHSLQNY